MSEDFKVTAAVLLKTRTADGQLLNSITDETLPTTAALQVVTLIGIMERLEAIAVSLARLESIVEAKETP